MSCCAKNIKPISCRNNSKKGSKSKRSSETLGEELQDEGLAKLICDIQSTACVVQVAVTEYAKHRGISESMTEEESHNVAQIDKSFEEIYLEEMKKLQFGNFAHEIKIQIQLS